MYFQRFKRLNDIFYQIRNFKIDNCIIINEYDIEFQNTINKLFISSKKFKMNIN